MSSLIAELKRMATLIEGASDRVSYVVVDSGRKSDEGIQGVDAMGRRYALFSSALIDRLWQGTAKSTPELSPTLMPFGLPIYRLENMPAGWPLQPWWGEDGAA